MSTMVQYDSKATPPRFILTVLGLFPDWSSRAYTYTPNITDVSDGKSLSVKVGNVKGGQTSLSIELLVDTLPQQGNIYDITYSVCHDGNVCSKTQTVRYIIPSNQ
jgi:hypothetical protein